MPVKTRGRAKREHEANRLKLALEIAEARESDAAVLRCAVVTAWKAGVQTSNCFSPMHEFPSFSMASASFESIILAHQSDPDARFGD